MKLFFCFFYLITLSFQQIEAYQDQFEIPVLSHPESREGPPLIHWCTMCGADNRYQMLKETVTLIAPYFDQIHIIDNGSTDETPTLVEISPKVTYTRIDNWDGDWTTCYLESIRYVYKDEWFMFHDSDERPSPELLKNLRVVTDWADKSGYNVLAVPSCHHFYTDTGEVTTTYEQVVNAPVFTKWNFMKREDMTIKAFGGHTGFHLLNPQAGQIQDLSPYFFYNHYKSQGSVRVSLFTHGFMYPTTFSELQPHANSILQVREKLGITRIQQLFHMLYTKKIPQEILTLVSLWRFTKGETKEIWELLVKDRCQFDLLTHCTHGCCNYSEEN